MKILTYISGILSMIAIVVLISLFFIKFGWSLFMVPVFNLPELTWIQALGLSLLASTFRSTTTSVK
jgi:hypothetical protein